MQPLVPKRLDPAGAAGKFTDYGLSVKALSAALGRNDAELLAKALVDAERAGVGREPWERHGDRRVSDVKPGLGALSDGDCAILLMTSIATA